MKFNLSYSDRTKVGVLHDKYIGNGYDVAELFGCEFKMNWDLNDLIKSIERDIVDSMDDDTLFEKYCGGNEVEEVVE